MKFNKWTIGLAAVGVVSLASAVRADEHMSQVQTALSNTTISGYVDTSMQWNPGTGTLVAPVKFQSGKADGFNLNVVDLTLDKPLDESQWASGYHVDLWFGPDAGLLNNDTWWGNAGNIAVRQAYIALRTPVGNGIDWKVGVFDSPLGYESTSAPLNPNYTRSYGYSMEPSTLTGVLGTYKVSDLITLRAGMADIFGPTINGRAAYETQKAYLAQVSLTAPDSMGWLKGSTLDAGVINAIDSYLFGFGSMTLWNGNLTIPTPIKGLKAGASLDYWQAHNSGAVGNAGDDSMWNLALYGSYQATDKLSLHLRFERLDTKAIGLASVIPPTYFPFPADYMQNDVDEVTATVQYNVWANVLSRLEFRWDHAAYNRPYGNLIKGTGDKENAFLIALNLIYQF